jgi:hypothetical protein
LPKKRGVGEIPTLEEWTIRAVIIFVKTRAIRVTEIGNTIHGGSCRRKFWFSNKPEVSAARRNDTFDARSLTTHTHTHTHFPTAPQQLTSLAVATTFFPAAADQLVYEHGKDLQQQRHHDVSSMNVYIPKILPLHLKATCTTFHNVPLS